MAAPERTHEQASGPLQLQTAAPDEGEYDADDYAEDESSGDEQEDRRAFGIHQCLPLAPGEEEEEEGDEEAAAVYAYLRQVRDEAKQLPDVVSAPADEAALRQQQHAADAPHRQRGEATSYSYLQAGAGAAPCDLSLKPSAAWVLDFLRSFAALQAALQREHELLVAEREAARVVESAAAAAGAGGSGSSVRLAPSLVTGGELEPAAREELAVLSLDPPSALMPELQALRGLDQLQVRRQLHSAIRAAVREGLLTADSAPALYALSARTEKPLHADTCALYRQLLKLCAAQRAAATGADDPLLPHLNIHIALAGAYFGQDEELAAVWDAEREGF